MSFFNRDLNRVLILLTQEAPLLGSCTGLSTSLTGIDRQTLHPPIEGGKDTEVSIAFSLSIQEPIQLVSR